MTGPSWEHFEHEADLGLRGYGRSLEEAFEQAALALTAAVTDPALVKAAERVAIACEAPDREMLLVDWLNAVVYEMATRSMLFARFETTMEAGKLQASAWGEKVDVTRHHPAVEVKAATYHALRVGQLDSGVWIAQCVVDV